MNVVDLPIVSLVHAPFNPNEMDSAMEDRLLASVRRFGVVENLVVRPIGDGRYEVLAGNQRLRALQSDGAETAPCVVADVDDTDARLLAQAMNAIQGEDDPAAKASLLRELLRHMSAEEVMALLPESAEALSSLSELGSIGLDVHLAGWETRRRAKLRHMTFQLTPEQLVVVKSALDRVPADLPVGDTGGNPNAKGNALFYLCSRFLDTEVRS